MTDHPYRSLPRSAYWRDSVATPSLELVDPVVEPKFVLSLTDRVATAGSCFAQHIARHLSSAGFNYLITERAPDLFLPHLQQPYNYGTFTARYANIYTTRQLVQLLRRAYGLFQPVEEIWTAEEGGFIDPYRPEIQPGGFSSEEEFWADRAQHYAAIRTAVETLDCFVFTLGLTECWINRTDGAVYPLCPGVSGGVFDDQKYAFWNMSVSDVLADMDEMRRFIGERNPAARFILTVSPVPLVASASGDHVLNATTFSKAILRVAAGQFAAAHADVAYFPSFEIVSGSYTRGGYFASDLRSVTDAGVAHVMRLFLQHYGGQDALPISQPSERRELQPSLQQLTAVVCEEEALQRSPLRRLAARVLAR